MHGASAINWLRFCVDLCCVYTYLSRRLLIRERIGGGFLVSQQTGIRNTTTASPASGSMKEEIFIRADLDTNLFEN
jgi:hypothetical protein